MLAAREYEATENGAGLQAPNRAHNLRTYFEPTGIRVHDRRAAGSPELLGLSLSGLGREGDLAAVPAGEVAAEGARVEIRRPELTEWYVNSAAGLEQGFTLALAPEGDGPIVLELALAGARAARHGDAARFATTSGRRLSYANISAFDARGEALPAHITVSAVDRVQLVVDDAGAAYPIVIDPLLSETADTELVGGQDFAGFGWSVATAGDVNGDGYGDIIVGAQDYDAGEIYEGAAFVFLGGASGIASGDATSAATRLESNQTDSRFGYPAESAGDVNGDGYGDVIVGAPSYDSGETDEGSAFIFLGGPGGIANGHPGTAHAELESNHSNSEFGVVAEGVGDVNADGYGDVIVTAYTYDWESGDEGAAFVFLGGAGGISSEGALDADAILEGDQGDALFGINAAGVGDVNGDGYADVMVGASYYDAGQTDEGAAFLFLGSFGGDRERKRYRRGFLAAGIGSDRQRLRLRPGAAAGDVNGDGYADVIVGAPYYSNGETDEGAVFVFLGSASGVPSAGPAGAATQLESNQPESQFGSAVADAGDVNGDGFADLLASAPAFDAPEIDEGAAFVFFGSASGITSGDVSAADAQLESNHAGAFLGLDWVSSAGDVNGDGYADVILGATGFDAMSPTGGGAAFVYLGSAEGIVDGDPATAAAQLESNQGLAQLGWSVASAGDVNGDGFSDVIVGAPLYDAGHPDEGSAFVFLGGASGIADGNPLNAAGHLQSNQSGASFGWSVASAGDVNGDGYGDVIVGAYGYSVGEVGEGGAFLFHGSPSGIVDANPGTAATHLEADQTSAQLGWSVAMAGDVNGDGYSDVVVGAPLYDGPVLADEGRALVFLGSALGVADGNPASAAARIGSQQANAHLGYSVGSAGDVNGDGFSDVIVGARHYDAGEGDEGAAFVFHGSASGVSDGDPANAAAQIESDQPDAYLGISVASAGDVNGDGYGDVITGAYRYDVTDEGAAFVFHGSASGIGDRNPASSDTQLEANQSGALLGSSVATAGDVNGDGYSDVIVGANFYDSGETDDGAAFVFLGGATGIADGNPATAAAKLESDQTESDFGYSVASAGDVNGDGFADVIVGALGFDSSESGEGAAFVFYGGGSRTGRTVLARQQRSVGPPLSVAAWGRSNDLDGFEVHMVATSPRGRERVKLQVEACAPSFPFGHASCTTQTQVDWVPIVPPNSQVTLTKRVTGLDPATLYRWRARVLRTRLTGTVAPTPEHGPWRRLGAQAVEADVRTQLGDEDSDDDGLLDSFEVAYGLDPLDPDQDSDNRVDGQDDFDADGLGNAAEAAAGTNPTDTDSDNDGLLDGAELGTGTFGTGVEIVTGALGVNSVFAVDLDGDGDTDVLSAVSSDNEIAWYENDGTPLGAAWTEHSISTSAIGAAAVFAIDVDGDGDRDVLSASQTDDTIAWYENDGTPAVGLWTERAISTAADGAKSVFAADVDGDGDTDVLSASALDDTIAWYENDGTPAVGPWTERTISIAADSAASVFAADVDSDGDLDVLSASGLDDKIAWYENDGTPAVGVWTAHTISTAANGATSVFASDVDGDGDADVLSASYIDGKIAWYENDGTPASGSWTEHTITTANEGALSVVGADVDGDGDTDVLNASFDGYKIGWYENDGTPAVGAWTEHLMSPPAIGAWSVFAADVDRDGDTDILSAAVSLGVVAWYEQQNVGDPLDPDSDDDGMLDGFEVAHGFDPLDPDQDSDDRVDGQDDFDSDGLGNAAEAAAGTDPNVADTDGDGLLDGQETGTGVFDGPLVISSSADGAWSVHPADMDGDGDTDALSASQDDNTIAWHENDGSPLQGAWPEHVISISADGPQSVVAADVDGDGDTDVLSASWYDDTIAWYENDGTPAVDAWTERAISTSAYLAESVFAADVDGDGDMDVLSASAGDDKIAWYENDGTPDVGSWSEHDLDQRSVGLLRVRRGRGRRRRPGRALRVPGRQQDRLVRERRDARRRRVGGARISTSADGATSVVAADVDGDGDADVLSASYLDDTIAWYENDGTPAVGGWAEHVISMAADGAWSVVAADVDGDGDIDVVSASYVDETLAWYENDGTPAVGSWTEHEIASGVGGATFAFAADVDDDADTDVLATNFDQDTISWYAQQGVSDPLDADSDDDLLLDGVETGTGEYVSPSDTGSDPLDADSDDDGFEDGFEVSIGSNPNAADSEPLVSGFDKLDGGSFFTCGIVTNGELACFGSAPSGQPAGTFKSLAAGTGIAFVCALRSDDTVACWGSGATSPPGATYLQIAAGTGHACGLTPDLEIECWGSDVDGQVSNAPAGLFNEVVAGSGHNCALGLDGHTECWGANASGQSDPPASETFVGLAAGLGHTCGLRGDGTVLCWGSNASGQLAAPVGSFAHLAAGMSHTCALGATGTIECWGGNASGESEDPTGIFIGVFAGPATSCGIRANHSAECWGANSAGEATPPVVAFPDVALGWGHGCEISPVGAVRCFGLDAYGRASPPSLDPVIDIASGENHSCALESDGEVICWGYSGSGQDADQPAAGNPFVQIDAGMEHTCGVRADGAVTCWGGNSYGESTPDVNTYVQVSGGGDLSHTCGVTTSGAIACWGDNSFGQAVDEGGTWRQVSAGSGFSCGVRGDLTLGCWGANGAGQATPPSGLFRQVEAGLEHACALETSGTVRCWGDATYGQTSPVPGSYKRISMNGDTSCGVLEDGSIACWGYDGEGQASPVLESDGDNRAEGGDNCSVTPNATQLDGDTDGAGDACDVCPSATDPDQFDRDGDGVGDACDNCIDVDNPVQEDDDDNGIGNACEETLVIIRPAVPPPPPGPPPGAPFGPGPPPPPPAGEALYDVFLYCPAFPISKVQLGVIMPQDATSANVDFGLGCTPTNCVGAVGHGLGTTVDPNASFAKGPDPAFVAAGARGDTVYFSIQAQAAATLCDPDGPDLEVRVAQFEIENPAVGMPTPSLTKEGLSAPPVNLLEPLTDDTGRVLEPAEYSFASVNQDPQVSLTLEPATGGVPGHRWQVELDTNLELHRVTFGLVAPAGTTTTQMRFIGCTTPSGPQPTRRSCLANNALGPYVSPATSYTVGPTASTSGLRTDTLYVSLGGSRTSGAPLPALNIANQPVVLGVVELDPTTVAPALTLDGVGTTAVFGTAYVTSSNTAVVTPLVQVGSGYNAPSDYDADGRSDDLDNCPYTANVTQANNGGFLTTNPDLYGDLCQCADGDGNGAVFAADTAALRAVLTGTASAAVASRCSVAGGPECDIRDYAVFKRALSGLSPGIASVCASAVQGSQLPPAP